MNWQSILEDFKNFLKLEKNLSENTANAYSSDLKKDPTISIENIHGKGFKLNV